ncbi:hypothetical protein NB311A_07298 [Nitrobacter sp. Nb-311A]|nr:hypothetical protein NB311A_07298 [Nitrobacter sp. Nb-311A]
MTATSNRDAELIRLGHEHDKLVQKLEVETARLRPLWDEHRRRMDGWRAANPFKTGDDIKAYDRLWDEVGLNDAYKDGDPDEITDAMDPICRKILAIPTMTLAGLLVKARVAKYHASEFWDEPHDTADLAHLHMRELCDAVIDMAARTTA